MKKIFSLFLVFHLFAAVFVANNSSYLNSDFFKPLVFYANLIGHHIAWQFFAPDPGPAINFHYQVYQNGNLLFQGDEPGWSGPKIFRESFNRSIATARFLAKIPENTEVFGSFLCRKFTGSTSVSWSIELGVFPSLSEVKIGLPLNQSKERKKSSSHTFQCENAYDS